MGEGEEGKGKRGATLLASWVPDPAITSQTSTVSLSPLYLSVFVSDFCTYHDGPSSRFSLGGLLDKTQSDSCKEGSGLLKGP